MGKFKTPFSSQTSGAPSQKRIPTPAPIARAKKLSILRLKRVDVITPRTKDRIKQRFSELAKQAKTGLRDTSPGVPVPFDLSQSQSLASQQPPVSQEIPTADNVTELEVDNQQENAEKAHDNEIANDIPEDSLPEEFYIDFGEENEDTKNENHDAPIVNMGTCTGSYKGGDTATANVVITNTSTQVVNSAEQIINNCNGQSKGVTGKSKKAKAKVKNVAFTGKSKGLQKKNKYTETECLGTEAVMELHPEGNSPLYQDLDEHFTYRDKVVNYLTSLPPIEQTQKKCNKRKNKVQLKKDVLRVICKMHQEIETSQRRRQQLLQGNIEKIYDVTMARQQKVPYVMTGFEE